MMDVPVDRGTQKPNLSRAPRQALSALLIAFLLTFSIPAHAKKQQQPVTDDAIHDQVLMKLAGDVDVKGGGIDVDVHNGVVTLKGKVEKEKQRTRAERLVKKVKGVTGVENQLVLAPK